ncbi:MAG: TIM barrel protein [Lachnospiraceae bacterium]|nr:TIM barrel protein [Lachnospiraceae bacterium]
MKAQHPVYINTCVFGTEKLDLVPHYIRRFGEGIGFEILPMFDLPVFEDAFRAVLDDFASRLVSFHGPVFEAEHSAPRGTPAYERTMWHVQKTFRYAGLLRSCHFTMHLNNETVRPGQKDEMLRNALTNYAELQDLFASINCPVFVENTGTRVQGNLLLDQQEFTDVCRQQHFDILIDLGHAHANGWDIPRLIRDLKEQIRAYHLHNNDGLRDQHRRLRDGTMDFDLIYDLILRETPQADRIIEYTRPELAGEALTQDLSGLLGL